MSASDNAKLGAAFFRAQDRLKGGPDPDLCTADYTAHLVGFPAMPREGHQQFAEAFYAAFDGMNHTIDEVVADEGSVAVRFTLRGTHSGEFMGIPATGKHVEIAANAFIRVEGGEAAELHGSFDRMGLMQQLGVLPAQ